MRRGWLALLAGLAVAITTEAGASGIGEAQAAPSAAAAGAAAVLAREGLVAAGNGRLTWFGIRAYDARLWVEPAFRAESWGRHRLALELSYLRDFRGADIARRSLQEMRRAGPIPDADAARWLDALRGVLPDVRAGDRILGLHLPGRGAQFYVNGTPAGLVADARFAELFFGIWLAPTTSAPELREALLASVRP